MALTVIASCQIRDLLCNTQGTNKLRELADGVKLVKRNLVLERQMQLAREVLREQADALQELAKR